MRILTDNEIQIALSYYKATRNIIRWILIKTIGVIWNEENY